MPYLMRDIRSAKNLDDLIFYATSPMSSDNNLVAVAENENTPPEALHFLATRFPGGQWMEFLIPSHHNTSNETLAFLLQSRTAPLKRIAMHRNLSPELALQHLHKPQFAEGLALNTHIPNHVLHQVALLKDLSPKTFLNLTCNSNLSTDTIHALITLQQTNNEYDALQLTTHRNLSPIAAEHMLDHVLDRVIYMRALVKLASNPVVPGDVLERISRLPGIIKKVEQTLASNPNLPVHLLEMYAGHPRGEVRAKVAGNRSTPLFILERLHAHRTTVVETQLQQNRNWLLRNH